MRVSKILTRSSLRLLAGLVLTLLSITVWFVGQAVAQPRALYFQHLQVEDGLSQRSVFAVHQDRQGFLWFGTQDGLNRWDGQNFTVYSHDPSQPDSMTHSQVRCLAEDTEGGLWVGTPQGLGRLSPTTKKFHHFRYQPGTPNSLSGADVRSLLMQDDGYLWVATRDGGVDRIEISTGTVNRLAASSGQRLLGGAMTLAPEINGGLWIGLREGLAFLPNGGASPQRVLADELTKQVDALHQTPAGTLWIGTQEGLISLGPEEQTLRRYSPDESDPWSLSNLTIRDILSAGNGDLWIATDNGLNYYQAAEDRFIAYFHDDSKPSSLALGGLHDLYRDRGGLLWIGTLFSGVDRVDTSQSLISIKARPNLPSSLQHPRIVSFAETQDGELLVGAFEGGIYRSNLTGSSFEMLDASPSLESQRPMSMLVDSGGDLWVGTHRAGLALKAKGASGFRHFRHNEADPSSLAAKGVSEIFEDSAGRLWVGTFQGGLDLFDRETETFEHHRHDAANPHSIGGNIVQSLVENSDGDLWVGLIDGGLDLFDVEMKRFTHFDSRANDPESLPADSITSLHLDDKGRLWIGTYATGLALLLSAENGGRFRSWNEQDGLPNNVINGVEVDDDGLVWVSTNKGIARLDPHTNEIRTFKPRHGLPSEDYFAGSHFKASNGNLYFGGPEGLVIFDPTAISEAAHRDLPIALTSLQIGDREIPLEEESLQNVLTVGHRDRTLKISFAALDYSSPKETEYLYRLDGFDDDWVNMGRLRTVTYTNLDPSEYLFRVSACTEDGLCNRDALGLKFDVQAPPWQTWWARLSYAVLAVGFVLLALRWRVAGLRRRSAELEALVDQRTSELSETVDRLKVSEAEATGAQRRALKTLEEALEERRSAQEANRAKSTFLSNMSHELRTPLNAMLGFAQLMERDVDLSSDHRESLGSILRSGEHLLGLINDVLSLSKIEAGKLSLASETFDPARVLNGVEEMTRGRAEQKGLKLEVTGSRKLPQAVRGDSGRLTQVLINLLSNAVKFTDSGKIELRVKWQDDSCRFEVEDTGVGMAPKHIEKLFEPFVQSAEDAEPKEGTGLGLPISRRLVEIMGGEMEVWSEIGKGSTFAFDIPLPEAASTPLPRRRRPVAGLALSQNPPRVLVVDDAEENRRLLRRLLGGVGINVRDAADGVEAVEAWANWRPNLIWMDMRMPRMDGYEATRRIRQTEAESGSGRTLIIALTATAFEHDRRRILAAGCDDVVTKPFQEQLLFDKLAEHLDVEFVYSSEPAPTATEETAATKAAPTGRREWQILVAEDNSANQLVARRMLERLGLNVEVVSNGRAAVDVFHRQDFDLVLMDVRMPELNGLEATQRLRRRLAQERQPVIVALTGLASEDERRKCLEAGMDAVLAKPFRLDDLEATVDYWLPPPTPNRPMPSTAWDDSLTDQIPATDVAALRRATSELTPGTLDYSKLEALRLLDRGSAAPLATQVIDLFLDTAPTQIEDLRRAVAEGDRHRWRRLAHSLKNSSGTLGAEVLAAACLELEELGRRADDDPRHVTAAGEVFEKLVAAATEALRALEVERSV